MVKIVNINTGKEKVMKRPPASQCSICNTKFIVEDEGGVNGSFGILPVSFCPFCFTSIIDMVKQLGLDDGEEEE